MNFERGKSFSPYQGSWELSRWRGSIEDWGLGQRREVMPRRRGLPLSSTALQKLFRNISNMSSLTWAVCTYRLDGHGGALKGYSCSEIQRSVILLELNWGSEDSREGPSSSSWRGCSQLRRTGEAALSALMALPSPRAAGHHVKVFIGLTCLPWRPSCHICAGHENEYLNSNHREHRWPGVPVAGSAGQAPLGQRPPNHKGGPQGGQDRACSQKLGLLWLWLQDSGVQDPSSPPPLSPSVVCLLVSSLPPFLLSLWPPGKTLPRFSPSPAPLLRRLCLHNVSFSSFCWSTGTFHRKQ